MGKAAQAPYASAVAAYERLVATNPLVERKGATMPYTSVGGHMFSFLTKDGVLALRLAAGERERFLAEHRTKLSVQHGVVMKEYVEVPGALLANTREMKKYFDRSYAYVGSLAPKPTRKATKAGAKPGTKSRAR